MYREGVRILLFSVRVHVYCIYDMLKIIETKCTIQAKASDRLFAQNGLVSCSDHTQGWADLMDKNTMPDIIWAVISVKIGMGLIV